MQQFLTLETDPYNVIELFPELLSSQSRDSVEPSSKLTEKEMETSLLALVEYLTEVGWLVQKHCRYLFTYMKLTLIGLVLFCRCGMD